MAVDTSDRPTLGTIVIYYDLRETILSWSTFNPLSTRRRIGRVHDRGSLAFVS